MIRLLACLLICVMISGCVYHPPHNHVYDEQLVGTSPPKPDIHDYPNVATNRNSLFSYTTAVNWYVIYMFAYTKVLNEYAIDRGWKAPSTKPICKLIDWPRLEPLPDFKPVINSESDLRDFEWELTHYIKKLRDKYGDNLEELDEAYKTQRYLCIY